MDTEKRYIGRVYHFSEDSLDVGLSLYSDLRRTNIYIEVLERYLGD